MRWGDFAVIMWQKNKIFLPGLTVVLQKISEIEIQNCRILKNQFRVLLAKFCCHKKWSTKFQRNPAPLIREERKGLSSKDFFLTFFPFLSLFVRLKISNGMRIWQRNFLGSRWRDWIAQDLEHKIWLKSEASNSYITFKRK